MDTTFETPELARTLTPAGQPGVSSAREARPRLKTTVVIPARNEAATLGRLIELAKPLCDEVLVVDGHSLDKTRSIAQALGARVVLDRGHGKGEAVRMAIDSAEGDIVVFMDADGSHDPMDIPKLVKPIVLGEADLVIGSRGKGGSDELHGDIEKLMRMVGSDLILIGINWWFRANLTDSQNGFRAIRTSAARQLRLRENITTIEQEMTIKCLRQGFRVGEVPTHEYARLTGQSSIVLRKVWFRYVYSFVKYMWF